MVGSIQLLPLEGLADAKCQHKGANPNPNHRIKGDQENPPLAPQTPAQWLCGSNLLKCTCSHSLDVLAILPSVDVLFEIVAEMLPPVNVSLAAKGRRPSLRPLKPFDFRPHP